MSADRQILLETSDLTIGYPKRNDLFVDLNLSLEQGSLNCLMGPNGSGKSTLLKTLTGLMKPVGGEIRIMGDPYLLKKPMRRARAFSVVLTGSPQTGLLRVRELVALGRHPYTGWAGNYDKKDRDKVQWALEAVRATALADRMLHTLSDGERQRVMVARALAQDTPLVFLDEPTAYLDLPHRIELMHIFRRLTHECGLTLLMSTHDLELSLQYADNLWLLGESRHCEFGTPEDLLLDGKLEKVFGHHELDFDRERGVFHARTNFHTLVSLHGHTVAAKWTRNALEKLGIGITDGDDARFDIEVSLNGSEESFVWKYSGDLGSGESYSVSELIRAIKQNGFSRHPTPTSAKGL